MSQEANNPYENVVTLSGQRYDYNAASNQELIETHEQYEARRDYILRNHPAFKRIARGLLVEDVETEASLEIVDDVKTLATCVTSNVIPFPANRRRS